MKLELGERAIGSSIEAQIGGESRTFKRAEEPFEVTDEEGKALVASGFFNECATVLIRFSKDVTSPEVKVAHGNYRRRFVGANAPFEVTFATWMNHLEPTGLFEVVPDEKQAAAATTKKTKTDSSTPENKGESQQS